MSMIHIRIPDWLDRFFTFPLLVFRLLRYGYTFRKIYLGEGEWTILEPGDYYRLRHFKWRLLGNGWNFYTVRDVKTKPYRTKVVSLHREIMNHPQDFLVDHRNGDSLDNRKANLRLATHSQNSCNRRKTKSKTSSRFIGVCFDKSRGRWSAYIRFRGRRIGLGRFKNEIDAAKAYDAAAKKYHGEFAKLNFPGDCAVSADNNPQSTTYNRQLVNVARPLLSHYNVVEGMLMNRTLETICCILFAIIAFAGCIACKNSSLSRSIEMSADKKMSLKQAKAKNVWEFFRQINRIPRGSKNEKQIIEWLKTIAKSRNLACRSDDVDNVIIELPATKGYEKSPAVVLQSHVDMVCEKTPESKHDFTKDPIELVERDGWITANGTTLGADDGVGVALALALLDEKISHPKLELLFTVDEETGLTGANGLKPGFITGKYLINLDGEDKSFIVGCAGGEQTEIRLPLEFSPVPDSLACFNLKISGLHGGHSGIDIDKQYANAIQLLGRTLKGLQNFDLCVCDIEGGTVHNAIPRDAKAVICFDASKFIAVKKKLAEIELSFKKGFSATEPNLKVELNEATIRPAVSIGNRQSKIVNLLSSLPTGVYRMSSQFDGIVETSSNLAKVELLRDENQLRIVTSQRSLEKSSLKEITAKITGLARSAGAKVDTLGGYPSWKPDVDSSLLKRAKEIYRKLNNKEPEVKVVHAGLEPAVIGEKIPGIEMISVGPTIKNPHSPQERVDIASVDAVWQFLIELIPAMK